MAWTFVSLHAMKPARSRGRRRWDARNLISTQVLAPGASRSSSSLRVVLHDSDDSERQGLAVRETLKASAGAPRHRADRGTARAPRRIEIPFAVEDGDRISVTAVCVAL